HLHELENDNANFESYSANPFLLPYLSKIIEGEYNQRGIAKALFLPRVLMSSITTSFGAHIKQILVNNNLAESRSNRSNIISFIDQVTHQYTGCVIKAGPNTINSGDKSGIRTSLNGIQGVEHRVIGVIYGSENDLNQNYLRLQEEYEIFIGVDFWYRITGYEDFYVNLGERLRDLSESLNTDGMFNIGLERLTNNIPPNIL
ncbi:PmeII family type II restriction endonuclease, partial [Sphingobacterium sp.]|uniref:PmeII family type II restriction endonuclease n=1 Tax=Sphingobacterium sp. TaxID=341027 RepID=UPI002898AC92